MRRPALIALAALAAAVPATAAIAGSAGEHAKTEQAKTSSVKVGDDYFAPTSLKVKPDSKVVWKWLDANTDTHNVVLTNKHPNGVKPQDFRSQSGSIGISYKKKFEKRGTYGFICTFHRSVMKMTVTVKKR